MSSAVEPQMAVQAGGVAPLRGLVAPRRVSRRPSTLQMVKEALQAQGEKGASVVTIKQFILAKYPTEDPIRLKYLLKRALSKGLSRGELVRPRNSSAVGATGTFMLAPKETQHKKHPGRANPDGGPAPKPGQKGTTKAPSAPLGGAQQRGAKKQQRTVAKPKAKAVDAQPQAAEKPRSDGAKPRSDGAKRLRAVDHGRDPGVGHSGPPRAAEHPQGPGKGHSGPPRAAERPQVRGTGRSGHPRAAEHPQGPGKGRSGPRVAADAEDAGEGKSSSSAGAGAKGPPKVPGGRSKGKVLEGAQQDVPKAQGGRGRVRKPRVTPRAGQGEAGLPKTAPPAEDRKAL